jgi:hypothetical protein
MLLSLLVGPLLAAQVTFEARAVPPPPPPPPPVGSPAFQREGDSYARDLALQCKSPEEIAIILAARDRERAERATGPQEWRIHHEAVAQAAWAEPFDAEAFAKAVRAEAEYRAKREITFAEANLALIAALSGRDRETFAHRMTTEVCAGYVKPC